MNLRIRGSKTVLLRDLSPSLSLRELRDIIKEQFNVEPQYQIIKCGFPPMEIISPSNALISTIFSANESLILDISTVPKLDDARTPIPSHDSSITTMRQEEQIPSSLSKQSSSPQVIINDDSPSHMIAGDGGVVKREMPDDNSCLFHAVKYCLKGKPEITMESLRRTIVRAIESDPIEYNEAILGREPKAYCEWIKKSTSWGGSVELRILSNQFQIEIAAFDVSRNRVNIFGEGSNFNSRMFLMYDGIHYDSLVWNLLSDTVGAPPPRDLDITLFDTKDQVAFNECQRVVDEAKKSGKFVDEYNYMLNCCTRCGQCGTVLKGNKEAVIHSKTTGHSQFEQCG